MALKNKLMHSIRYYDANIGDNYKFEYILKTYPHLKLIATEIKARIIKEFGLKDWEWCIGFNQVADFCKIPNYNDVNFFSQFSMVANGVTGLTNEKAFLSMCHYLGYIVRVERWDQKYRVSNFSSLDHDSIYTKNA